jgi:hypothetical protein
VTPEPATRLETLEPRLQFALVAAEVDVAAPAPEARLHHVRGGKAGTETLRTWAVRGWATPARPRRRADETCRAARTVRAVGSARLHLVLRAAAAARVPARSRRASTGRRAARARCRLAQVAATKWPLRQERPLLVLGEGGNQREVRLRRLAEDDRAVPVCASRRPSRPPLPPCDRDRDLYAVIAGVSSAAVKVGVRMH